MLDCGPLAVDVVVRRKTAACRSTAVTKMIDSAQRPKIKRIARVTAITTPTTAGVLASALNTAVTVVQTGERSPTSSRFSPSSPETNRASGWASSRPTPTSTA